MKIIISYKLIQFLPFITNEGYNLLTFYAISSNFSILSSKYLVISFYGLCQSHLALSLGYGSENNVRENLR